MQASNRHADNVIFNILVRLRVKELTGQNCMLNTLKEQYSRVTKAAATICKYQGTTIMSSLINTSSSSWQIHLKRIAPYLINGKGIWWSLKDGNYHFHDADDDPDTHEEGPDLLHFRNTTIDKLCQRNEGIWDEIIQRRSYYQHLVSTFMTSEET